MQVIDWIKNKLQVIKAESSLEDISSTDMKKVESIEVDQSDFEVFPCAIILYYAILKVVSKQIICCFFFLFFVGYYKTAISRVQPSSKREGFATVPDVSWDDIGALQNVRDELKTAILVNKGFFRFSIAKF